MAVVERLEEVARALLPVLFCTCSRTGRERRIGGKGAQAGVPVLPRLREGGAQRAMVKGRKNRTARSGCVTKTERRAKPNARRWDEDVTAREKMAT